MNRCGIVFSSVIFLFFFLPLAMAVAVPLQLLANRHATSRRIIGTANLWLLIVSVVFYAWGEVYLVWVMLASCLLNYGGGQLCAPDRSGRRVALVAVVAANLALLAWFKYSGLLADVINRLNAVAGNLLGGEVNTVAVVLPLGISFYTFHGISYVVDVWRGKVAPSRNLRDFLCYSTLFPQLVAGPIVRYSEVAEYLSSRRVGFDDFVEGTKRFAIGLGKKALIANQVAILADAAFALPESERSGTVAWLGITAYALQIYFDFSGYSDMAIGLGRVLGFKFPENFNYPYVAGSVRDFWRRWHMTLSRFFRDYLYIPLGGNRSGAARTAMNLMLVFALCGLWHGASWNFLFWGLMHGSFLALERVCESKTSRVPRWMAPFGHVYTLGVVLLAWVVFRCETWAEAAAYFRSLAGAGGFGGIVALPVQALEPGVVLAMVAGVLFATPIAPAFRDWLRQQPWGASFGGPLEAGATLVMFALCLLAIGAGSHNPFIYYRF